jgi:5-methylthioadenosine/S-adenosylhomocysteine deaminase
MDIDVKYLYEAPESTELRSDVKIRIAGDRIGDLVSGEHGDDLLAMPALVDAHDHARGLHHIAFGARDQNFELWRAALYAQPPIDPYLNAALAFGRLAQSGVGSVMHVYSSIRVDCLLDDAEAIARAARVGIRLGFVMPLRDTQTLGYGSDEELLSLHDPQDRPLVKEIWLYPFPSPQTYMDLLRGIAGRVTVQLGPNSPQACSEALLEAIASSQDNRRITTHLLETSIQRKWADAKYPRGFIEHLCDIGVICERFTGAHGVWLRPNEVALLAADVLALDFAKLSYDLVEDMIDPLEVVLTRASARHVKSLYVAGREIVRDGKVTGVDLPAIEREVIAQARANAARVQSLKPIVERSQATLARFYAAGRHAAGSR